MATRIRVIGICPLFAPDNEESIISMNTIPLAPSRILEGKKIKCKSPVTKAVAAIPAARVLLPYSFSSGGPTTSSSNILLKKCCTPECPNMWPKKRT